MRAIAVVFLSASFAVSCAYCQQTTRENGNAPAQQSDPCANPRSGRVGIIASNYGSESEVTKRASDVANRFADTLAIRFRGLCIVRDIGVFSDPVNFPMLKGTPLFEVSAYPSAKDPKVAAIAVEVGVSEGAYFEQYLHLGAVPVLIESEADFDRGAGLVFATYNGDVQALSKQAKHN